MSWSADERIELPPRDLEALVLPLHQSGLLLSRMAETVRFELTIPFGMTV